MNYEIEYKFKVSEPKIIEQAERFDDITQGYFVTELGVSIRIRLKNQKALLCIKGHVEGAVGHVRNEFEYEIPYEDGEFMLKNYCKNRVIEKRRHYIEIDGFTWEIDQFKGHYAGLVIAEIEVPSLDTKFNRPEWIGEDVSNDFHYTNSYMAKNQKIN